MNNALLKIVFKFKLIQKKFIINLLKILKYITFRLQKYLFLISNFLSILLKFAFEVVFFNILHLLYSYVFVVYF